jgi:hypothetical protein
VHDDRAADRPATNGRNVCGFFVKALARPARVLILYGCSRPYAAQEEPGMAHPQGDRVVKNFIRCKVYPGQFSDEFAVSGQQADGERFSLFVPAQYVAPEQSPTRDAAVDGWLQVSLWEQSGGGVVVKLPRESFESGRFVTVGLDQFKDPIDALEPQP